MDSRLRGNDDHECGNGDDLFLTRTVMTGPAPVIHDLTSRNTNKDVKPLFA